MKEEVLRKWILLLAKWPVGEESIFFISKVLFRKDT